MFYKQQNVSRLTLILIMAALTLTACGGNADTQPSVRILMKVLLV